MREENKRQSKRIGKLEKGREGTELRMVGWLMVDGLFV